MITIIAAVGFVVLGISHCRDALQATVELV